MLPILRKPTLCVDIGSHSMKVLELRRSGNAFQVTDLTVLPCEIHDDENQIDSAIKLLMEYLRGRRIRSSRLFLALPSDKVYMRSVPERGVLDDRLVRGMLRNNSIARVLPDVDVDRQYVSDWQILDQNRAEKVTEVYYAAAEEQLVAQYRRVAEMLKQTAALLDIAALALARLVPLEGKHLILHVGHRGTEVVAVQDGRLIHNDHIGFGGDELLGVILRLTGTTRKHAQMELETYGFFNDDERVRDGFLTFARDNLIQYILELCMHLARETHVATYQFDQIWLSGGAGRFMGLIPCLQNMLEMPTAMLDPFRELRLAPAVADDPNLAIQAPLFAICAGLALREGE